MPPSACTPTPATTATPTTASRATASRTSRKGAEDLSHTATAPERAFTSSHICEDEVVFPGFTRVRPHLF
eukprot:scaffold91407_cov69-Phaeocystis_antarctica.AAC.1